MNLIDGVTEAISSEPLPIVNLTPLNSRKKSPTKTPTKTIKPKPQKMTQFFPSTPKPTNSFYETNKLGTIRYDGLTQQSLIKSNKIDEFRPIQKVQIKPIEPNYQIVEILGGTPPPKEEEEVSIELPRMSNKFKDFDIGYISIDLLVFKTGFKFS